MIDRWAISSSERTGTSARLLCQYLTIPAILVVGALGVNTGSIPVLSGNMVCSKDGRRGQ